MFGSSYRGFKNSYLFFKFCKLKIRKLRGLKRRNWGSFENWGILANWKLWEFNNRDPLENSSVLFAKKKKKGKESFNPFSPSEKHPQQQISFHSQTELHISPPFVPSSTVKTVKINSRCERFIKWITWPLPLSIAINGQCHLSRVVSHRQIRFVFALWPM